jgi:polygalacturonase
MGIEFSGIYLTNSPMYHILPTGVQDVYMHDFEIYVDVMQQLKLHQLFGPKKTFKNLLKGNFEFELPIYPLNTDGIDPDGVNMTFTRIKITTFDDAIVPKPSTNFSQFTNCTQEILIEDCEVVFGFGMSMGSMHPAITHSCIKDITVRNINYQNPFKAIYIKTNTGKGGDGLI